MYKNERWLQQQRFQFANSRNNIFAGRTGPRTVGGGKPQPRWEAGVQLAKSVSGTLDVSLFCGKKLSVGTRIRAAVASIRIGSLPSDSSYAVSES